MEFTYKNTPVVVDGEKRWLSRSEVCSVVVFANNNEDEPCVLANLRGPGCEFLPNLWNIPGGFLDYGETQKQAAARECYEETGVVIWPDKLRLIHIDDDPNRSKRQNITHTFMYIMPYRCEDYKVTNEYSEPNEVAEIKWIPIKDIEKYQWTNDKQIKLIDKACKTMLETICGNIPDFDIYKF